MAFESATEWLLAVRSRPGACLAGALIAGDDAVLICVVAAPRFRRRDRPCADHDELGMPGPAGTAAGIRRITSVFCNELTHFSSRRRRVPVCSEQASELLCSALACTVKCTALVFMLPATLPTQAPVAALLIGHNGLDWLLGGTLHLGRFGLWRPIAMRLQPNLG